MPGYFTLRMQFGPHQDPEDIKKQLLDLVKQAPVDEIMFFFFAEEQNDGHDTHERVRQWIERSRPYRQALAEAGVKSSLNPWHTLLHYDGGRKRKPGQNWQVLVDQHGRAAETMVCPLDRDWQAYFAQTLEWYAQEGFRVIWIDDDIRFHNHAPLEWGGCFCPLHVAEFNRRAGTQATREAIVAACTAPGEPHPWRAIWMDMWQETLLAVISRWRDIAQAHGVRLGLMSSLPEQHGAEGRCWAEWWEAFGGSEAAAHRPHFWGYGQSSSASLARAIALLDQNRLVQPDGLESGPEIENFPYGAWNKPFRQVGAQMALAHILGSTNLNISLYDFMGNRVDDEPERIAFLRRWRPICDWLADNFPMTLRPVGVGLPWSEEMGRKMHTDGSGKWPSLICPTRGWANWLGAAGHAFSMRPSPVINALSGPMVWCFSDEELRGWLGKSVLLDGIAASILVERGLGEWIGIRGGRLITQQDTLYSFEHCLDGDFALRAGAEISLNRHLYAERLFQGELLPGARVVSDLRGPTQDIVGQGLFVYQNKLGGRIAVAPWSADTEIRMNIQRAAQLSKTLAWLDPSGAHGAVSGGAWLVPQFLSDGRNWRGVIWNANVDEVSEIIVQAPAGMPPISAATQVNARGERRSVRVEGNKLHLAQSLRQWEFIVLL